MFIDSTASAVLHYATRLDARKAKNQLNGKLFRDRLLKVDWIQSCPMHSITQMADPNHSKKTPEATISSEKSVTKPSSLLPVNSIHVQFYGEVVS